MAASFPQSSIVTPTSLTKGTRKDSNLGSDHAQEEGHTRFHKSSGSFTIGPTGKHPEGVSSGNGVCKMHRFSLYETATCFYLVGGDILDQKFRILKIKRTVDPLDLCLTEDDAVYSRMEMNQLLKTVDDGSRSSGGLKIRCSACGLVGFIRFTWTYYMMLITKRSQVAIIGGHYIYRVDGTELVSLSTPSTLRQKSFESEESRYLTILQSLDLSKSFYFSYSYDITRTLQENIRREKLSLRRAFGNFASWNYNTMFIWNQHLLDPALGTMKQAYDWCLPIIHGFVDQATLSIYGRTIHIAIIARRSRHFAGARFLKRGVNDLGYVANDVETEQIVSEMLTTSLHAPNLGLFANPNYTSYVQHRGSIPLHWTQDNSGVSPKPGINLNLVDPFYTAASLHFDNLFERYGAPIYILNLVKARERNPRESILLREYTSAISYLNQFLPDGKKLKYKAWDMSRSSKSRDHDVIGTLEAIAEDVLQSTGFFHNGTPGLGSTQVQNGVARTNCIDCLDRTNAAQFVIGKRALGHQLQALGVIDTDTIEYDTDAVNLFTHMFHDHGDTIAVQYGGSHLVNTMETYRKINQWTSHSRDMVESFKRYYNNSFLDKQRQEAYNLFLGNYTYKASQPMLWDLTTDYYLHHIHPRDKLTHTTKQYTKWYDVEHLQPRSMPFVNAPRLFRTLSHYDDYWLENYRPLSLSSFTRVFCFKMNSTLRYVPFKSTKENRYDLSPFRVRERSQHHSPEKGHVQRKVVNQDLDRRQKLGKAIEAPELRDDNIVATDPPVWLRSHLDPPREQEDLSKDSRLSPNANLQTDKISKDRKSPKDKAAITQWTLNQFVMNSLDPVVTRKEAYEYQRYVSHPHNLSLVASGEPLPNPHTDLVHYISNAATKALWGASPTGDELVDLADFLEVGEEPLTVLKADAGKKRYKAYGQWIKGKSLFKQRVEP